MMSARKTPFEQKLNEMKFIIIIIIITIIIIIIIIIKLKGKQDESKHCVFNNC